MYLQFFFRCNKINEDGLNRVVHHVSKNLDNLKFLLLDFGKYTLQVLKKTYLHRCLNITARKKRSALKSLNYIPESDLY